MPDVIVIGGGPAGAAAAIGCARAGLDVVVLDQDGCAANKTGETLHPGVEPLLEQLGVADTVRGAGFLRHDGIEVTWGGPARFEAYGADANGAWRGFQACRATFDEVLLQAVLTSGGSIRRGIRARTVKRVGPRLVALETDAGSIEARWLVDASGRTQWLGRRLGLRLERLTPQLICWYGFVRRRGGDPPRLSADRSGWTWAAEVSPGLYQWTRLTFGSSRPDSIPVEGESVGKRRAADVTWRWFPGCAGPNYFLVGDAAAVFDPSSSHGILRALMTGIYAAHLIVASERNQHLGPIALQRYRHWLGSWVRHDDLQMRNIYRRLPRPPRWALSNHSSSNFADRAGAVGVKPRAH